jgi:hypothetical protein
MPTGIDPKLARGARDEDAEDEGKREGRERKALTQADVWQRRAEWAALQSDGVYMIQIAEQYGVDISTVSKGIQALIKKQQELGIKSLDLRQARQLAKYAWMESELVEAWQASKGGRKVNYSEEIRQALHNKAKQDRKKEKRPKGNGTGKYKKYTREENSYGDPRFMSLLIDIEKDINKILAVYPIIGKEGGPQDDTASLTAEERANRITALMEQARLERARQLTAAGRPAGEEVADEDAPLENPFDQPSELLPTDDAPGPEEKSPAPFHIDTSLKPDIP